MLTLFASDLILNTIKEYETIVDTASSKPINECDLSKCLKTNVVVNINNKACLALSIKPGRYMLHEEKKCVSLVSLDNINESVELSFDSIKKHWPLMVVEDKDESTDENSFDDEDQQANFTSRFDMGEIDRNAIVQAMKDQNISVTDLANKMNVDKSTISRYLRKPDEHGQGDPGGRDPSIQNAAKLANHLRTNIQSLFPDLFKIGRKQKKHKANRGSGVTSVTKNIKGNRE